MSLLQSRKGDKLASFTSSDILAITVDIWSHPAIHDASDFYSSFFELEL